MTVAFAMLNVFLLSMF